MSSQKPGITSVVLQVSYNKINDGMVEGKFPKRALRHVLGWYELHKDELTEDWELCRHQETPKPIEPLE